MIVDPFDGFDTPQIVTEAWLAKTGYHFKVLCGRDYEDESLYSLVVEILLPESTIVRELRMSYDLGPRDIALSKLLVTIREGTDTPWYRMVGKRRTRYFQAVK